MNLNKKRNVGGGFEISRLKWRLAIADRYDCRSVGLKFLSDYGIPIWLKMTQGSQLKISKNGRGMKSGYPSTEALKTTLGGKEET